MADAIDAPAPGSTPTKNPITEERRMVHLASMNSFMLNIVRPVTSTACTPP